MVRSKINAAHPEISTKQGSARSLVAIDKWVIRYDAKNVSTCFIDDTWVHICTAKSLERLRQCRVKKSFVAQAIKSAKSFDYLCMDGEAFSLE
ncbi:hypothetical protein [Collinsella sp. zg1085]|uniref:hypothetical protein n=1 Tax=Collinsella sp. zg1085 TaxID=2844380 RepID=UPI00209B4CFF|nr:hypothetical protein [Collinsella sp. zg1085]